jgi:hypothetical protein
VNVPDSFMDSLNQLIRNDPTFRDLFPQTSSPSYRYWTLKAGEAHNRHAREYAYTTQRARGPGGKPVGFYAMIYERVGNELRLKKAVRFARRSKAKERAHAWFQKALARKDPPAPAVTA